MPNMWERYTEIELTEDEEIYVDNYGLTGRIKRDGNEVALLAQEEECVWGILAEDGELVCAYALGVSPDARELVAEICRVYDARICPDSYAQGIVIEIPSNVEADLFVEILERVSSI